MDVHRVADRHRARIFRTGVLWPGLLLLASACGAAADVPAEVTLEQALSEALALNPALAVERREIDIAKGARRQAGIYPFNPELEAEGGGGSARERVAPERALGNERRGVETQGVGLSQTIWIRGQRGIRVRGAAAGLTRAQSLAQDAERQVVAETVKGFGDVIVSQDRLALAQELLTVTRSVRGAAQKLFEADAVPQLDVFRAEVEVSKAENRAIGEERALATARRELALLIGRPVDRPLRSTSGNSSPIGWTRCCPAYVPRWRSRSTVPI